MLLSIIMPVYNEQKTLLKIIDRVLSIELEKELVIVDDGSTDGSTETLKTIEQSGKKSITILYHSHNRGKGAAIQTALGHIKGAAVIIQDADMEYDPREYPALLQPVQEGKSTIVYGSRILGKNPMSYGRYYYGGRLLTLITNILYGTDLTDVTTCYKLIQTDIIKEITLERTDFSFCAEITAKLIQKGHHITDIPISYYPRKIEEGKKIRWTDGLAFLYTLVKYRIKKNH